MWRFLWRVKSIVVIVCIYEFTDSSSCVHKVDIMILLRWLITVLRHVEWVLVCCHAVAWLYKYSLCVLALIRSPIGLLLLFIGTFLLLMGSLHQAFDCSNLILLMSVAIIVILSVIAARDSCFWLHLLFLHNSVSLLFTFGVNGYRLLYHVDVIHLIDIRTADRFNVVELYWLIK